jgi:hypothetical protein
MVNNRQSTWVRNALHRVPGFNYLEREVRKRRILSIQADLSKQLLTIRNRQERLFFIVLVPGCLHIARKSLDLIPESTKIILILNGLDDFEEKWIIRNLNRYLTVKTPILVRHYIVINSLFNSGNESFGILDFDCFVYDANFFEQISQIKEDVSFQTYFAYENKNLGLSFPETFFLFMNASVINDLRKRYSVSAAPISWSELNSQLQHKLGLIGIGPKRMPEQHKSNFDTLRLIMALSLCEKRPFNFLQKKDCYTRFHEDIVHVGGVSYPIGFSDTWKFLGSYFWLSVLEAEHDIELRQHYSKKYGKISARKLLDDNPTFSAEVEGKELETVDRIVSRLISI